MEPLDSPAVDVNALEAALDQESAYRRLWLPPEPWWPALVANKSDFATAVHRQLVRGTRWPRSETIDVRKPGHGIRPISLMSPEVRVAYRAIASSLIAERDRVDRSAQRYAEFVLGPIVYAFENPIGF
jgi:hypothetical protein